MDEWLDYSEFIDKAQELIDLGLFDEARRMLDESSQLYSDEWEIYFLYSRIFTEENKPEEAIPYLHRGLRIDKKNADCLLGLFYAHAMMNNVKKGGKYLLRALKLYPDNEQVQSSLIWYYAEMNDLDLAIKQFEDLREKGTDNPEVFRNGGLAYQRAAQYENAENCFKAALETSPDFDEVRDLLVDLYLIQEKFEQAIAIYQDALKKSPKNIRLLSRLVFCYSQSNQSEKASTLANETITFYPNSPIGYVDLAYVYLNTDEYDKAIASAEKAIDISPIDPEAYRVKGIAYSEKQDEKNADEAFQAAISLSAENIEIIRDYYHHLRSVKQFDKMEEWVQTAIKREYPYCMEDYWFLADYYRENDLNLKAFHFLHKAYKAMPGEKELIPPLVDILLDYGHSRYSLPFLARYVEKAGWDEIMSDFSKHSQLKGKWSQEGLRFLRFSGQRPTEFRTYIFLSFIKRFLILFSSIIALLSFFPIFMLFKLPGIAIASLTYTFLAGTFFIMKRVANKNIDKFKSLSWIFN